MRARKIRCDRIPVAAAFGMGPRGNTRASARPLPEAASLCAYVLGSALLRHLITLARRAGLRELIAEVLPENTAMLRVLERSGLRSERKRGDGVVHISLRLD